MGLPDQLWKGIIEEFTEEFIRFFFPDHVNLIQFQKGFDYLDKELQQLIPKPIKGERRADLLIKGKMMNEEEFGFLIHTEIQGYKDHRFGLRMFESAYRIRDRYQIPTTTLVIYTDDQPKNHFDSYKESFMGSTFEYQFNTFSLIKNPPEKLAQDSNLFAIILESAWQRLRYNKWTDEVLLVEKIRLIRKLFEKGLSKNKIEKLLDFVQYYAPFEKKENNFKFKKEIFQIQEIQDIMGIRERLLEEFKRQGLEEGRKEGRKEGLQEGVKEGVKSTQLDTAKKMLKSGTFQNGLISLEFIAEITGLSMVQLLDLKNEIEGSK